MTRFVRSFAMAAVALAVSGATALQAQTTTAATFGQVIALGGTPSDLVLDQNRQLIYLVNTSQNRIDVFSTATNAVIRNIAVGTGPLSAAMSMDGNYLYVTNGTSSSLTTIDLNAQAAVNSVSLPATPQGVEVGADGRALVSTTDTTGVNTLLIYDRTQGLGNQLTAVVTPPPPSTPSALPPTTLQKPTTTFLSKLLRTPDGRYIIGITNPTSALTYLFVYEVASGTILRSRTVAGQSTVLAVAPDGSRFMAGYTMYETSTLSILGQMNNANAPFSFTAAFNTVQNVGGGVFSPDGTTVYGAFNVAANSTPAAPTNSSTLLMTDPTNLAIRLGIRMPESIVAKMVITSDGTNAWSLSQSGLIYLPLSTLYKYPILMPSATQVFLSQNPCNPGLAQATVQMNNIGGGNATFAISTISSALTSSVSSGLAPATITFTMEPGRLGVVRQAGTNITTGTAALSGAPLDVSIASTTAINLPPLIRVYMNYRNPDQRGITFPLPTIPNNSPNSNTVATGLVGGDQGLIDIVLDQPRNRVYISNAGYNRVEVFDTVNQVFLSPIPVGQLPHQMGMSTDGNYLYVASTGGELISIIDLNIGKMIGHVPFPPLPRQAGGTTAALIYPQAMAVGTTGLQFIMSNGTQWSVVGGTAVPRAADTITKQTNNTNTIPSPSFMLASPDNSKILTLSGSGTAYLFDGPSNSYIANTTLYSGNLTGVYGPLSLGPPSTYFTVGALATNSSLTILPSITSTRNVIATAPFDASNFVRFTTPTRTTIAATITGESRPTVEMVNVNTGATKLLAVGPEQPRYTNLGTTRYNLPPRTMVIDNNNVAYVITLSGLSVIPLTPSGATAPAVTTVSAASGGNSLAVGSVINVFGSNLATPTTATTLPPPTVLGGSCVTMNDVPLTLLSTTTGQIQAQIPAGVSTGQNVLQVRSLATGLQSTPLIVTVAAAGGSSGTSNSGSVVGAARNSGRSGTQSTQREQQ